MLLAVAGCTIPTDKSERRADSGAGTVRPGMTNAAAQMCLAELSATGARLDPLPDRVLGDGCGISNAVQLSQLQGDQAGFGLANIGPLHCPTARNFAAWARYGVDRAARQILGSALVRIDTMGSYACRNVGGTGRRSAHARAEAVDIGAFVLADGRRITVLEGWNGGTPAEREFLRVVHRSACRRFGTVLGPDYNAAHHDHLHLENGDGSFCR